MRRPAFTIAALLVALVASCTERTEPYRVAPMPRAEAFGSGVPAGNTAYDNGSLADLFVLLTHGLENGEHRKALQRFESPVNVGMTGPGARDYVPFLNRLVDEIRREAQVPIGVGAPPYNLLVRFVPGEEFLPRTSNQCMVVFGQPDWETLVRDPRPYSGLATKSIDTQTLMSVIIPDTIEPYKVRECLLEEITQALGTANDLYGVAWTIFNDDNAHSWPTRLDYLMLHLLYHPDMHSGLSREQTREVALRVLDQINPQGRNAPPLPAILQERFLAWRQDMLAQDRIKDPVVAIARARELAARAHRLGPDTAYDCTGATFLASIARHHEAPDTAELLDHAIELCTRVHGADDVRIALLRLQVAYLDLDNGLFAEARKIAEEVIPVFMANALDGSVAAAYIVRMAAAWRQQDPEWDGEMLETATEWSAFAYGEDHELTSKLRPH